MVTPHIAFGNARFGAIAGLITALMAAANIFLGISYPSWSATDLRKLLAASAVVPILLALSLTDVLLSSYFHWDPSGRALFEEIRRSGIPVQGLLARTMSRGQRYSLSFYLHSEVTEWEAEHPVRATCLREASTAGAYGDRTSRAKKSIQFAKDGVLSIPN